MAPDAIQSPSVQHMRLVDQHSPSLAHVSHRPAVPRFELITPFTLLYANVAPERRLLLVPQYDSVREEIYTLI